MRIHLLKWIIRPYLRLLFFFEKWFKTGAFNTGTATLIPQPYQESGNQIKESLHRFHVKQFHESSCSVATVASVINTLLFQEGRLPEKAVTQEDLLENVKTAHWKERMSDSGYNGRRGLPLETLGRVVKSSLDVYQISYKQVDVVQMTRTPETLDQKRDFLLQKLKEFDQNGTCLLIAHFDQGSFLPELHIPHISPVGGFDPASQQVKILDVDSTQTYPYTISFDTFYKGLSTNYNFIFRHYGYAEGGIVLIRL